MSEGRAKAWEEYVSTSRKSPVLFAEAMTKIAKGCDEGESSKITCKMYFAADNTFTMLPIDLRSDPVGTITDMIVANFKALFVKCMSKEDAELYSNDRWNAKLLRPYAQSLYDGVTSTAYLHKIQVEYDGVLVPTNSQVFIDHNEQTKFPFRSRQVP